jgi:3-isopropylmalate dehydratase small subunit
VRPFDQISGYAAPLMASNIDTDQLLPKQFMRTIVKRGLADALFYDARRGSDGLINSTFVLNQSPFDHATIMLTGENFGCGSSREHAVWALNDFGIRSVIGVSFGEIFAANCANNGLLLIVLDRPTVQRLADEAADGGKFTINLPNQVIVSPSGAQCRFEIDATLKARLLTGSDAIDDTLQFEGDIARFEAQLAHDPRAGQA